jgi:hypothetical protein
MEFPITETFQRAGTFEEALCHHLIRQSIGLRLPSKKILTDYTADTSEGRTKLLTNFRRHDSLTKLCLFFLNAYTCLQLVEKRDTVEAESLKDEIVISCHRLNFSGGAFCTHLFSKTRGKSHLLDESRISRSNCCYLETTFSPP